MEFQPSTIWLQLIVLPQETGSKNIFNNINNIAMERNIQEKIFSMNYACENIAKSVVYSCYPNAW